MKSVNNVNMECVTPGEQVQKLRHSWGLTQIELSKLSGISQSNISAIEKNRIKLGRQRTVKLAKVLKVHPGDLLFPEYKKVAKSE